MQHVSQVRLFLLALAVCLAATCGLSIKKTAADSKPPAQEQRAPKSRTSAGPPDLDLLSHVDISPEADDQVELKVDDGSFETAVGLTAGGTLYAVNRLTPPSYPATLTHVKIFFRRERFGGGVALGDPVDVLVAAHANGSDSIDLTQFQILNTTIQNLGEFILFDVPDVTINSGDFLVGFRLTHPPGQFPIALDGTAPLNHRSYVSFNGSLFSHIENANLALIGNFGLRAEVTLPTPVPTCTYGIAPGSQSFTTSGGTGNIDVTTSLGTCSWTATTSAPWITITTGSGTGNGRAAFTVMSNTGVARGATINIAGQVFTVTQAGIPQVVILGAVVMGKQLLVSGQNFDAGARLFIDGANTKKVFNDETNPTTLLIARKAGKTIASGQTVTLQVQNAGGVVSAEFKFTRP